ncbi:MAG: histidine kinase [Pyrinomonadaceae bacterium]|nr:histidine kinase [Pyrinomonadaceae bacterium]
MLRSLSESIPLFYVWFAFTPFIFWFGRKLSFERDKPWVRNLLIHVVLGYAVVSVYLLLTSAYLTVVVKGLTEIAPVLDRFFDRFYMIGHYQLIIYWAILGTGAALDYYKKYREREIEASRLLLRSTALEAQLNKAQLDSLKMQLHPHFLFNTLHAVSALIEDDPKGARRVIARLGELLRSTLDIADQQTVPLKQEIELTKLYLEIEQERFGDKLDVEIDVPSSDLDCMVPTLILQPLIENAIKHGIKDAKTKAMIEIRVSRANKKIEISVSDNGPGFSNSDSIELGDGIGLSNTKARLEQLYGDAHSFKASNNEKGGAVVRIIIPCNRSKRSNEEQ